MSPLEHLQVMPLLQKQKKEKKESKSECKTGILHGAVLTSDVPHSKTQTFGP